MVKQMYSVRDRRNVVLVALCVVLGQCMYVSEMICLMCGLLHVLFIIKLVADVPNSCIATAVAIDMTLRLACCC